MRALGYLILKARGLEYRLRGWQLGVYIRLMGGQCGENLRVGRRVYMKHPPHTGIKLGNNVSIGNDVTFDVEPNAALVIGNNVKLTGYCFIGSSGRISIGNQTLIAEFVSLRDSNHTTHAGRPIAEQPLRIGELEIGEDVWIGRGAAIIGGGRLGDGAVVAANAVVRSEFGSNDVVAGVPARVVGRRHDSGRD